MWSIAQTLDRIREQLPGALVPEEGLTRALEAARWLPAQLTDCLYLERWLHGGSKRVDLIVRIDERGRALLATPSLDGLDQSLRSQPAWQRVAAFAREWSDPEGGLAGQLEGAWLEFDLPPADTRGELPTPRVFVDFVRGATGPPVIEARRRLAEDVLRPLIGAEPGERLRQTLRTCMESLPEGAFVPYVGISFGDAEPSVRLCVQALGGHVVPYLEAVGWPGDTDDLDRSVFTPLRQTGAAESAAIVHLDLVPRIAPRIGLEYAFARAGQREGRVAELGLLDHLVSRGWCSPAVRDDLLSWPGHSVELLAHEIWLSQVRRRLSHVKLTYATGQEIAVKAYLCLVFALSPGGTLIGTRPWRPGLRRAADPTVRQPGSIG